jgi:hypothetical protein
MGLFDPPYGLSVSEQKEIHRECRECGTNVDDEVTACPDCDGDVVEYSL